MSEAPSLAVDQSDEKAAQNWLYGSIGPVENRQEILRQLEAANRYQNKLVEIELERRKKVEGNLLAHSPALCDLEQEITVCESVQAELLKDRSAASAKERAKVETPEIDAKLSEIRTELRDHYATRKKIRTELFADAEVKARLKSVDEEAAAAVRDARSKCDAYWGTYLLIEQAADAFRKGAPPKFQRWDGTGRIGVQVQGGMSFQDALDGNSTLFRLTPYREIPPWKKPPRTQPKEKTLKKRYLAWVRIGSDDKRQPIWAKLVVFIHRKPSENCRIKYVTVQRDFIAGKERWSLMLTITGTKADFARPRATSGIAGLDIGYRVMPAGSQRVGFLVGNDGKTEDYRLPPGKVSEWAKVDELQSRRDLLHNEAREKLTRWMENKELPGWFREATAHIEKWRSIRRLSDLVDQWSNVAIPGDQNIIRELCRWRETELHLWSWQENLRDQMLAWRKDLYRNIAANLRKRYRTIVIEKMDLRDAIHDVLRPKDKQEVFSAQRRAARFACLSSLLKYLEESGIEIIYKDPKHTTSRCHACGHKCEFDHANELRHTCESCGKSWDQDENSARNLLAAGLSHDGSTDTKAAKKASRSERLKNKRSTKKEIQAAKE